MQFVCWPQFILSFTKFIHSSTGMITGFFIELCEIYFWTMLVFALLVWCGTSDMKHWVNSKIIVESHQISRFMFSLLFQWQSQRNGTNGCTDKATKHRMIEILQKQNGEKNSSTMYYILLFISLLDVLTIHPVGWLLQKCTHSHILMFQQTQIHEHARTSNILLFDPKKN